MAIADEETLIFCLDFSTRKLHLRSRQKIHYLELIGIEPVQECYGHAHHPGIVDGDVLDISDMDSIIVDILRIVLGLVFPKQEKILVPPFVIEVRNPSDHALHLHEFHPVPLHCVRTGEGIVVGDSEPYPPSAKTRSVPYLIVLNQRNYIL